MIEFFKSYADKLLLLFLILWFMHAVSDPASRTELGKDVVKIGLGALIGLIQGARLAQRRADADSGAATPPEEKKP